MQEYVFFSTAHIYENIFFARALKNKEKYLFFGVRLMFIYNLQKLLIIIACYSAGWLLHCSCHRYFLGSFISSLLTSSINFNSVPYSSHLSLKHNCYNFFASYNISIKSLFMFLIVSRSVRFPLITVLFRAISLLSSSIYIITFVHLHVHISKVSIPFFPNFSKLYVFHPYKRTLRTYHLTSLFHISRHRATTK